MRRNKDEFDAVDFRRSGVMVDDDPMDHHSNSGHGAPAPMASSYNPRPPTMIERKMNNTAGVGATGYGGGYGAGYGATANSGTPYNAQGTPYSDYPSTPGTGASAGYAYQNNSNSAAYGYTAQPGAAYNGAQYGDQYSHGQGYSDDYAQPATRSTSPQAPHGAAASYGQTPAAAPAQRVAVNDPQANATNRMSTATVADDAYGGI